MCSSGEGVSSRMYVQPARSARAAHARSPSYAEASRGSSRMSRLPWRACRSLTGWPRSILFGLSVLLVFAPQSTGAIEVAEGLRVEIVAVGIPRPTQLALDARGHLVVLSLGARGDAAAEIYRIDPAQPVPVDGTWLPHVVVP